MRMGRLWAALLALLLIGTLVLGGCTNGGGTSVEPPANSGTGTDTGDGGGTVTPDKPADGSGDGGGTVTPGEPTDGSGDGGGTVTPDKPADGSGNGGGTKEPAIVAENEAFRIAEPAEDAVVGTTFTVSGEARVFEAAFSYSFEDGHNVLAEGHVMADQGAPEWGKFKFDITFKEATSPFGVLTIYEISAKDGSKIHVLHIPVKFADEAVKPVQELE